MSSNIVTLKLNGERAVGDPSIIGVQTGDVENVKSKDGEPHVKCEPLSAVKPDLKESERITMLLAPLKFFGGSKTRGELNAKDGGVGLPDPPTVAAIDPSQVARGSSDTVITVSGTNFCNSSIGLVNDAARFTVFEN